MEATDRPRERDAELKQLGVWHPHRLGPTARGDARPDADIDLFFNDEQGEFALFERMEVKIAAARILACNADIVTRGSIRKAWVERIEANGVPVF